MNLHLHMRAATSVALLAGAFILGYLAYDWRLSFLFWYASSAFASFFLMSPLDRTPLTRKEREAASYLLAGLGVAGFVLGTVLAWRATG